MSKTQLAINFDVSNFMHTRENNPTSEKAFKDGKFHFTGQRIILLNELQRGRSFTTIEAATELGIGDLRSAIRDLRNSGVKIDDEPARRVDGSLTRAKRYFIRKLDTNASD